MIEEPKVTWTQEMHKYTGGMNVNAKNFQWYGSVPWFLQELGSQNFLTMKTGKSNEERHEPCLAAALTLFSSLDSIITHSFDMILV